MIRVRLTLYNILKSATDVDDTKIRNSDRDKVWPLNRPGAQEAKGDCQDAIFYMSSCCINLIILGETVFEFFTKKLDFYFVSVNLMIQREKLFIVFAVCVRTLIPEHHEQQGVSVRNNCF